MIQNFGSKPQMICKTVIETVIIMGFLYLMINSFKVIILLINSNPLLVCNLVALFLYYFPTMEYHNYQQPNKQFVLK